MMRRYLIILILIIGFASCQNERTKRAQSPNVIYILTDQWRSTALGYDGNPTVKTPNLDNFSKEAVIFKNAVSVCPLCTPYRAALMTGRFPTSTGMFMNDLYLPSEELCMAEIFKNAGYRTAYYGKWHLDGHGRINNVQPHRRQGFDHWKALECSHQYNKMPYYENEDFDLKYWYKYSPFSIVEDAQKYLEEISIEKNPFLLFISFATPHFPHHKALEEYKKMYPKEELILRENVIEDKYPNLKEELQGYYAHCTATDKAIGDLIGRIKDLDLYNNSIIIFTSDHGEMMGSHGIRPKEKSVAYDESIKIPFLISYPGIEESAGKEVFTPLNTPDILPTMLSLADIEIPDCIEGEDLSSIIKNPEMQKDRPVLFMMIYPITVTPVSEYRGIRTTQYTYVKTIENENMLFDNVADPYQLNNLIGKTESLELQKKMDRLLQKELEAIGDENFKAKEYYAERWGYGDGRSIPYNITPGKITRVYTPQKSTN